MKNTKRKKRRGEEPSLVFIPILVATSMLTGCDGDPQVARDRYASLEECVADWGDVSLCERQQQQNNTDVQRQGQSSSGGGGTTFVHTPYFFGPTYDPSNRGYTYPDGRITRPTTTSKAVGSIQAPASQFVGKPGVTSQPGKFSAGTQTGGFGKSGATASAAGHGSSSAGSAGS